MNVQNLNHLRELCGGEIPPGVLAYVEEVAAAYLRIKGGEFRSEVLAVIWMQAVRADPMLEGRLADDRKTVVRDWSKTKLTVEGGEKVEVLRDEGVKVLVDWAGLNRHGTFMAPDPNNKYNLMVSLDDLKGEVQSVPVCRVRRKDGKLPSEVTVSAEETK